MIGVAATVFITVLLYSVVYFYQYTNLPSYSPPSDDAHNNGTAREEAGYKGPLKMEELCAADSTGGELPFGCCSCRLFTLLSSAGRSSGTAANVFHSSEQQQLQ